jgi:hypothetical protein
MLLIFKFNRNGNKASVSDAALGDHMPREMLDAAHRSSQYRYLHAAIVIKVDVHCGNRQIVVLVKGLRQAPRQSALLMIIDVDQCGHS